MPKFLVKVVTESGDGVGGVSVHATGGKPLLSDFSVYETTDNDGTCTVEFTNEEDPIEGVTIHLSYRKLFTSDDFDEEYGPLSVSHDETLEYTIPDSYFAGEDEEQKDHDAEEHRDED